MKFSVAFLLSFAFSAAFAADWPQWRGPARDGIVPDANWPDSLDEKTLIKSWHLELQPSYSGPIVVGDRVFVTETVGKTMERVRALDRATGRELWQHAWEGSLKVPFFAKANGDWIRATPACDGETVFVAGMRDVLVALDAKSGEVRWRFDFCEQLKSPLPAFGFVSSPLVEGDAVYAQAGSGFCKLDKKTGKLTWRTLADDGGMMGSAFSSPSFATLGGRRQILVQTRSQLAGVDPIDGVALWTQEIAAFRGMNILTPLVLGEVLFTSTYGGKTIGWNTAVAGGKWTISEKWRHKSQGYMTTPVVIEGTAYTHLRSERLMAIDVATGAERWTSSESFGKYVSLAAQDAPGNSNDLILALDQRGNLILLKAKPDAFEVIDRRKVSDNETWAHIAVSGDAVFVRDLYGITAWRWSR